MQKLIPWKNNLCIVSGTVVLATKRWTYDRPITIGTLWFSQAISRTFFCEMSCKIHKTLVQHDSQQKISMNYRLNWQKLIAKHLHAFCWFLYENCLCTTAHHWITTEFVKNVQEISQNKSAIIFCEIRREIVSLNVLPPKVVLHWNDYRINSGKGWSSHSKKLFIWMYRFQTDSKICRARRAKPEIYWKWQLLPCRAYPAKKSVTSQKLVPGCILPDTL